MEPNQAEVGPPKEEVKPKKISFEVADFQPGDVIITPCGRVATVADKNKFPNLDLNDCDIPIIYLGEDRAMQWSVTFVEQKLTEEQKAFVLAEFENQRLKFEEKYAEEKYARNKRKYVKRNKKHLFSGEVIMKIVKDIVKEMQERGI